VITGATVTWVTEMSGAQVIAEVEGKIECGPR
jgi:hypothetical protein